MINPQELSQFTGTEHYHCHLLSDYLYTDGVMYVIREGKALWLVSKILITIRKIKALQKFSAWELKVLKDKSATLICTDGNKNILYKDEIEYTDFPLDSIKFWFEYGVLILPSEH